VNPNEIRILNAADVRRLLPMDRCVALMREAFVAEAEGRTVQPIRQGMAAPNGLGVLSMMPGALSGPDWLGIKVITIFPGNFGGELRSHQGMVLLFDSRDGRPVAMLDGGEITAIRTAAATAAATDVLAPFGATTLAIFGYGDQAETHLEAIGTVRALRHVKVWGRDPAKAAAFAERHGADLDVRAVATPREAADADILCLTTAASEPYFEGAWLRAGHHINLVGSGVPTAAEVDANTLVRAKVYVDFETSARALAGELRRAWEAGAIGEDHILGSVGQVLTGKVAGRSDDSDITLFKSLGMVAEDLVAADHVLRAAEAAGEGQLVAF
jgi:ornithine cyclodeaminase/alanine dehydrogenase-like protein (mu-crystallin family)